MLRLILHISSSATNLINSPQEFLSLYTQRSQLVRHCGDSRLLLRKGVPCRLFGSCSVTNRIRHFLKRPVNGFGERFRRGVPNPAERAFLSRGKCANPREESRPFLGYSRHSVRCLKRFSKSYT